MWRPFRVAVLLLAGYGASARAGDAPYLAYVNSADVYVRSGPGRDYYPTDKLQKGQEIEVYRQDPGGWLAVRPPQGSFSWVTSRNLEVIDDDLAMVRSDRTVARVGSNFSETRDVIQVRLDKDEKVELLAGPTADSPWCKIAPPAGEFRWVFAKYVDRELPADLAEDDREASGSSAYVRTRSREQRGVRLTAADAEELESDPSLAADRDAHHAEFSDELARLRELDRIDMDLSAIVASDISSWNFTDLTRRAQHSLGVAQDALERGRVRLLLNKLTRFEDIKHRHDELAGKAMATAHLSASGDRGLRASDPRYDGVGRLSPVVSQKTGGPQYALINDTGDVLSFVTPAPGVNLRPYVDKYVGVNGQRGYMTDAKRQHISVQRVAVIDTERR